MWFEKFVVMGKSERWKCQAILLQLKNALYAMCNSIGMNRSNPSLIYCQGYWCLFLLARMGHRIEEKATTHQKWMCQLVFWCLQHQPYKPQNKTVNSVFVVLSFTPIQGDAWHLLVYSNVNTTPLHTIHRTNCTSFLFLVKVHASLKHTTGTKENVKQEIT